jgi:hypothetical protein
MSPTDANLFGWAFSFMKVLKACHYPRLRAKCKLVQLYWSRLSISHAPAHHTFDNRLELTGGRPTVFPGKTLETYCTAECEADWDAGFCFIDHVDSTGLCAYPVSAGFVHVNLPLQQLAPLLSKKKIAKVGRIHHMKLGSCDSKADLCQRFDSHNCVACNLNYSVFKPAITHDKQLLKNPLAELAQELNRLYYEGEIPEQKTAFPPAPVKTKDIHQVIDNYCSDTQPSVFQESGCAVCAKIIPCAQLSCLSSVKNLLHVLETKGTTRKEQKRAVDPIEECKGPVLNKHSNQICENCRQHLRGNKIPPHALANGFWIGDCPSQLSGLQFIEKLLIQRVQVNGCFLRVASSGLRKMVSHVIAFESPVPKVYNILPPPMEDLDDVLAVLFTGPCKPSEEDIRRTPLLVRWKEVADALEWLKLNHKDYADLTISYDELNRYPEHMPPVTIEYKQPSSNKIPEATSLFDSATDDGVQNGDCPFVVHGITGEQLTTKTVAAHKGIALQHWNNKGPALSVSHASETQSIYNNPGLYPQIFRGLYTPPPNPSGLRSDTRTVLGQS